MFVYINKRVQVDQNRTLFEVINKDLRVEHHFRIKTSFLKNCTETENIVAYSKFITFFTRNKNTFRYCLLCLIETFVCIVKSKKNMNGI
jgi:hypothetical protein